jgi:hypothetical protein
MPRNGYPDDPDKVYDRTANLNPNYEFKPALEYGTGYWSVHKETGEVCDCKMQWNDDGTILSCPVCGLDGT